MLELQVSSMSHAAATAAAALLLSATSLPINYQVMLICLAGGIGGGMVAILLLPRTSAKANAAKWLGSSMSASLFGPAICHYLDWMEIVPYILAVAGLLGLASWGFLSLAIPMAQKVAVNAGEKWLKQKLNVEEPTQHDKTHDHQRDPGGR